MAPEQANTCQAGKQADTLTARHSPQEQEQTTTPTRTPSFSRTDPTDKTHLSTTTIGLSELVMSMHDLYMMSAPESSSPKLATCMANCEKKSQINTTHQHPSTRKAWHTHRYVYTPESATANGCSGGCHPSVALLLGQGTRRARVAHKHGRGEQLLLDREHDSEAHDRGTSARPSIRQHQQRIEPPVAYVAKLGLTKAAPLLGKIRPHGHIVLGMKRAACRSPAAETTRVVKTEGQLHFGGCRRRRGD